MPHASVSIEFNFTTKMEGINRRLLPLWNNLKKRLKLKHLNILSCYKSSNWVLNTTTTGEQPLITTSNQSPTTTINSGTINLAAALEADRRRGQQNVGPTNGMIIKPLKTIVRLFEVEEHDVVGTMCCLCVDRCKGAALIPCGHTYCRMCARAMWSKHESCPVCNRSITEVLEIF